MARQILTVMVLVALWFLCNGQMTQKVDREHEAKKRIEDLLKSGKITKEEAERMFYQEMQKSLYEQNTAIEFYGKVIDQEGNPVSEAEVSCSIGYYTLNPNNYMDFNYATTKTDGKGMFEVKAKSGISVGVMKIKKDGYEDSFNATNKYAEYTKDGYIFEHKTEVPKSPDPNNPEIFVIRKKGEPTLVICSGSYGINYSKGKEESFAVTFIVNAMDGGIKRRPVEEAKKIGLRTDAIITLRQINKDTILLNIKPEGEDGGILESKERLYVLPDQGYKKELDVEIKRNETYYFAVKSGTPKIYSLFCIEGLALGEESVAIRCYSISNPYGERNLESDVIENANDYRDEAKDILLNKKAYPVKPQFKVKWWEERQKKEKEGK